MMSSSYKCFHPNLKTSSRDRHSCCKNVCNYNFKLLAQLKVKIEKFEVSQSPILTSLIYHWILTIGRELTMEKFELQKPISQLLDSLKNHFVL